MSSKENGNELDISNGAWDSSTRSTRDTSGEVEDERDEIKEMEKFSQSETRRVRLWRLLVTFLLATTGVVVSTVTYKVLLEQENSNFEDAFERFSQTVSDAAVREVLRLRELVRTFSNEISVTSKDADWPYYSDPSINIFAQEQWKSKGIEDVAFLTRVKHEERDNFVKWYNTTYEEWIDDGHMRLWGNLNNLVPIGFANDIQALTSQGFAPSPSEQEYYPLTYRFPPTNSFFLLMLDIRSINYGDMFEALLSMKNETLISNVNPYIEADEAESRYHERFHSQLPESNVAFPHCYWFHPVHREVENPDSDIVGVLDLVMAWDASLRNLLPDDVEGIIVVGRNNCGQDFSYEIVGKDAFYIGDGDKHDPTYDHNEVVVNLDFHEHPDFFDYPGHCAYSLSIYPSNRFKDSYSSKTPKTYVAIVSTTFFLMIVVFYVYDWFVQRRNRKLLVRAAKSNEIVASMFPSVLQDKMFGSSMDSSMENFSSSSRRSTTSKLRSAASGKLVLNNMSDAPLAELYLDTTVMFADIVGFTPWASVREPPQVFKLLETVFQAFDDIARSRRVFKVETVGDCYVAVSGFPEPQKDHAVRMCTFAHDCRTMFDRLVNDLEVSLGPDTGDLGIRIGIHSGPVTAGLLRGDRARFQLFGDTVNTTARMESTGESGRIQVSHETAELLLLAGKKSWLSKREEHVDAKGKGQMQTYWMVPVRRSKKQMTKVDCAINDDESINAEIDVKNFLSPMDSEKDRVDRLIDWNTSTLLTVLKKIVARREILQENGLLEGGMVDETSLDKKETFLEEVKEIIELPEFDAKVVMGERDPNMVQISETVVNQLRDYVASVASLYRKNPFHNFEHASHVTMSVYKLLSRIVAPSELDVAENKDNSMGRTFETEQDYESNLHDHTYGITSDPLTQFACALSALIHDIDHSGVPNGRLIEENEALGARYKNRSVAEQNSLQIAWDMLMEDKYAALRATIYSTQSELKRFRELVVNSVMATDITDKDLKNLRNGRWDKAFQKDKDGNNMAVEDTGRDAVNRKATIVIEHLIQASDVAHTMQHWHVYRKWNERLFEELYVAWQQGRATSNPANFWAKGEIGFFDFYVIPLAKKLKDCGVFGISSAEYLSYAMKNRREWLEKGEQIVAEMVEKLKSKEESAILLD